MGEDFRVGHGYDIHRLARGRRCILGGIEIPSDLGLEGHSDADCLTHAIADALLGAAGLPDIGTRFPPSDPAYKDIDSQLLLSRVRDSVREEGYIIGNIDSTVIAEQPRILNFVPKMKARLAETLDLPGERIGIKATTHEKTGSLGRGEAIAAHAVCLLRHNDR